jgi:hypothetical protein
MSTPIKTLIQWVYRFLLIVVFIGFSGWDIAFIGMIGTTFDPSPQHAMLWQNLAAAGGFWLGMVECCAAIAALLVFCLLVELVVWGHNRRCVPDACITSGDLLCFPTRRSWKNGRVQQS